RIENHRAFKGCSGLVKPSHIPLKHCCSQSDVAVIRKEAYSLSDFASHCRGTITVLLFPVRYIVCLHTSRQSHVRLTTISVHSHCVFRVATRLSQPWLGVKLFVKRDLDLCETRTGQDEGRF